MHASYTFARISQRREELLLARRAAAVQTVSIVLTREHNRNRGATVSAKGEVYTGTGYAVGLPKYNLRVKGKALDASTVADWLRSNFTFDWDRYFGSWYDVETDTTHLDVSQIFDHPEKAAKVAKDRGEKAIWAFAISQEIRIRPAAVPGVPTEPGSDGW